MSTEQTGFAARLRAGEPLYGTFVKTPTFHATEILGSVGYDFVVIDEEHAPFNPETTDRILMACHHAGIAGVVRVSRVEDILRVLDSGADGSNDRSVVPLASPPVNSTSCTNANSVSLPGSRTHPATTSSPLPAV